MNTYALTRRQDFAERIARLSVEPVTTFRKLVESVGLDPTCDLRFHGFAHCPFPNEDLRGFDFSGCDLRGATFKGAKILGARFDCANLYPNALSAAKDFAAWRAADLQRAAASRAVLDPSRLPDLASFREAPWAPEMVVIPAGAFDMGSDDSDRDAKPDEKPKRTMRIPRRFAIGKYPVTFEEFDLFCDATGRKPPEDSYGWGRERRPIIDVSWRDAMVYAQWLNERLGAEAYGLPSEAQAEYANRAYSLTRYWWGDPWDPARANGNHAFEGGRTSPVGAYPPNAFGLYDTTGNVWEWCADEWTEHLAELPEDGVPLSKVGRRSRKQQKKNDRSLGRALRGGSWYDYPRDLRSAVRYRLDSDSRSDGVGFRLSRTL